MDAIVEAISRGLRGLHGFHSSINPCNPRNPRLNNLSALLPLFLSCRRPLFFDCRLSGGQPCNGYAERRATHIGQPDPMTELYRVGITSMFAANPQLEIA